MYDHTRELELDALHAEALLVGAARRREEPNRWHAARFIHRWQTARTNRLANAVATFLKQPFEPYLPSPGQLTSRYELSRRLACSEATIERLASKAGFEIPIKRRGWYAWSSTFPMTEPFSQVLREWCRKPTARPDRQSIKHAVRSHGY